MQAAAIDEKAAAGEQKLIGNGNADNSQHQQPEDGEIAVGCDPLEDGAFQLTIIAEFRALALLRAVNYPAVFLAGVTALLGTTEKNSMKRFFGSGAGATFVSSMHWAREVNCRPSSLPESTQRPAVMARWTP